MPILKACLYASVCMIAVIAAEPTSKLESIWTTEMSDPISFPVGVVKLGAANSSNSWLAIRPASGYLIWTRTPFVPSRNNEVKEGKMAFPDIVRWTPFSNAINDSGMGAVTISAHNASGEQEMSIVLVDTNTSIFKRIPVPNFFPHWVQVDSRNRVWVIGWHYQARREDTSKDFPLIRVYSQNGDLLSRVLPRSVTGMSSAQMATNGAFTALLGDDFFLHIRGSKQLFRLSLNDKTGSVNIATIAGPNFLDGPKSYVSGAAACGSSLTLSWRNGKEGGAGLLHQIGQSWTPFELKDGGTQTYFSRFAGCTEDGKLKVVSARGNLLTLSAAKP